MKIDRFNDNTMRRYHLSSAIAIVSRRNGRRTCWVINKAFPCVSIEVSAAALSEQLRAARS